MCSFGFVVSGPLGSSCCPAAGLSLASSVVSLQFWCLDRARAAQLARRDTQTRVLLVSCRLAPPHWLFQVCTSGVERSPAGQERDWSSELDALKSRARLHTNKWPVNQESDSTSSLELLPTNCELPLLHLTRHRDGFQLAAVQVRKRRPQAGMRRLPSEVFEEFSVSVSVWTC